jgi:hypothetical protein
MKHARLVWTGFAVVALAGTAAFAIACSDKAGRTTASAASMAASGCTAEMAANCTPEMAAARAARGAKASAVTASAGCCAPGARGAAATTAAMDGCATKGAKASAVTPSAGCCAPGARGAAATTAAMDGCATKGAKVSAVTASAGCCAAKGAAKGAVNTTAAATPTGRVDAMPAGASCGTHGKASGSMAHTGCDACDDMASCQSDIAEAGGRMQVVPLKNGLMYVYTAESSAKVRAVQAAVGRHAERMQAVSSAADKATLCPSCKELRGAAASGKLTREVVNIESGCLTLVTSSDARLVSKLYALAGVNSGARTAKS